MKILFCGKCYAIHSFPERRIGEGQNEWVYCDCKQMAARWLDENAGTVQVLAQLPELAFIIGMNNNFLRTAVCGSMSNEGWQKAHGLATLAPDHVFDAHRRGCWACVLRVGETADIKWHEAQEKVKAGLSIDQALFMPVMIKVNTQEVAFDKHMISYADIVRLSGKDPTTGVIYSVTCYSPGREGRCLNPSDSVRTRVGMIFHCMYTGNA